MTARYLIPLTTATSRWLRETALPLWAGAGFDATRGVFEEQLDFSGRPVTEVPRRVMVQARQISVFAAAALSGRYPGGADLALRAARAMIADHLASDGAPGWVFSVDRAGRLVEGKRDLYAHAFVLFALSWALRLERDPGFEAAIEATLAMIDGAFADRLNGGYWDCLPRADGLRRQNPHMHLFEALLSLYEATGRDDVLGRCRQLHGLAIDRFIDGRTGALREYYDDAWRVHPAPGAGRVEPGHLFEWAWLLRRYERASGEDQSVVVGGLLGFAERHGLDAGCGRIVDELGEDGTVHLASSRSWPHAEALKALTGEAARGRAGLEGTITAILARLGGVYCVPRLGGGWVDHVDAEDFPLSRVMPASTLYHVYFGMTSVDDWVRGRGPGDSEKG